jgi:RimJ/RimL family protein N-acetyltransferase
MGGDVHLREVVQSDLSIFFAQQSDAEATRMAAFPARDHAAFLSHWAKILVDPAVTTRAITVGGRVAGNILSWDSSHERLVGYWLGREYWGLGIATRALALFLAHERTRPLHAHVAKHNAGSLRVLLKNGFQVVAEGKAVFEGEEIDDLTLRLDAGLDGLTSG